MSTAFENADTTRDADPRASHPASGFTYRHTLRDGSPTVAMLLLLWRPLSEGGKVAVAKPTCPDR